VTAAVTARRAVTRSPPPGSRRPGGPP
jgi:hypothetical protein